MTRWTAISIALAAFFHGAAITIAVTALARTQVTPPTTSAAPADLDEAFIELRQAERLQAVEVKQSNQAEAIEALCLQSRVLVRRGDPRGTLIAAAREACPLPEVSP